MKANNDQDHDGVNDDGDDDDFAVGYETNDDIRIIHINTFYIVVVYTLNFKPTHDIVVIIIIIHCRRRRRSYLLESNVMTSFHKNNNTQSANPTASEPASHPVIVVF